MVFQMGTLRKRRQEIAGHDHSSNDRIGRLSMTGPMFRLSY